MDAEGRSRILRHWVHWSLLAGVIVSGVLLALGLVTALASGQSRPKGAPSIPGLLRQAVHGEGVGLLYVGLLLLIATPILRVVVLAVGWAVEKQWRFAAVAVVVLTLLGLGLLLGVG